MLGQPGGAESAVHWISLHGADNLESLGKSAREESLKSGRASDVGIDPAPRDLTAYLERKVEAFKIQRPPERAPFLKSDS